MPTSEPAGAHERPASTALAAPRPRPVGMLARATDKPGLGIEIDLDAVAKHPFEPELLQRVFYADGSVGDW